MSTGRPRGGYGPPVSESWSDGYGQAGQAGDRWDDESSGRGRDVATRAPGPGGPHGPGPAGWGDTGEQRRPAGRTARDRADQQSEQRSSRTEAAGRRGVMRRSKDRRSGDRGGRGPEPGGAEPVADEDYDWIKYLGEGRSPSPGSPASPPGSASAGAWASSASQRPSRPLGGPRPDLAESGPEPGTGRGGPAAPARPGPEAGLAGRGSPMPDAASDYRRPLYEDVESGRPVLPTGSPRAVVPASSEPWLDSQEYKRPLYPPDDTEPENVAPGRPRPGHIARRDRNTSSPGQANGPTAVSGTGRGSAPPSRLGRPGDDPPPRRESLPRRFHRDGRSGPDGSLPRRAVPPAGPVLPDRALPAAGPLLPGRALPPGGPVLPGRALPPGGPFLPGRALPPGGPVLPDRAGLPAGPVLSPSERRRTVPTWSPDDPGRAAAAVKTKPPATRRVPRKPAAGPRARGAAKQRAATPAAKRATSAPAMPRTFARLRRRILIVSACLVLAVVAGAAYLLLAPKPSHVLTAPAQLGAFAEDPTVDRSTAQALREKIVAGAAGEVKNVVAAVYQQTTGPGTSQGPQIMVFIGGNLTGGGSASGFIGGFTTHLRGSFTTSPGRLGGQAACAPGSNGGPAECAWADNDTFGVIVSATLGATGLASEMRQMRPLVEHAAR